MTAVPHLDQQALRELLGLAKGWASAPGLDLSWREQAATQMLTDPCPTTRALWRCALELAASLERLSGRKLSDLLADPVLEPIEQDPKGPGG